MKKILSLVILFTVAMLNAQNVNLSIKLNPIQTITVNSLQRDVELEYTSENDYDNGVSSLNSDHLKIYSTGGFQVNVRSALTTLTNGNKSINANSIQIKAYAGSNAIDNAIYHQNVSLTSTESAIVSSTTGGANKTFNIEYKGAGSDQYINNYIAGQSATFYTTEVMYTIISQ